VVLVAPSPIEEPQRLLELMPYAAGLGVRVCSASAEQVRGELDWAPERCTAGGVLHGGALMSLADSVGALCAHLNLPPGASTGTVESSTRFFRAVRAGTVRAVATVLHAGRSFVTVRTDLHDDRGRLVGTTPQTQAVVQAR
jgi:1,4-dihydroxy-2-naphthoyl-CoA hydrolase